MFEQIDHLRTAIEIGIDVAIVILATAITVAFLVTVAWWSIAAFSVVVRLGLATVIAVAGAVVGES